MDENELNDVDDWIRRINRHVSQIDAVEGGEQKEILRLVIAEVRQLVNVALDKGGAENIRVALLVSDKVFELLSKTYGQ